MHRAANQHVTTLRLPRALYDEFCALARREQRTASQQIRYLMKRALNQVNLDDGQRDALGTEARSKVNSEASCPRAILVKAES
jgi:hypothetical protein